MQQLQEIVQLLENVAQQHRLSDRAIDACRAALAKCEADEMKSGMVPLRGWSSQSLDLRFEKCSLVFSHVIVGHAFFDTQVAIYQRAAPEILNTRIGTYRLISTLDGKDEDDYLTIEVDRPAKSDGDI